MVFGGVLEALSVYSPSKSIMWKTLWRPEFFFSIYSFNCHNSKIYSVFPKHWTCTRKTLIFSILLFLSIFLAFEIQEVN